MSFEGTRPITVNTYLIKFGEMRYIPSDHIKSVAFAQIEHTAGKHVSQMFYIHPLMFAGITQPQYMSV